MIRLKLMLLVKSNALMYWDYRIPHKFILLSEIYVLLCHSVVFHVLYHVADVVCICLVITFQCIVVILYVDVKIIIYRIFCRHSPE